jgi:hypothetical protein
MIEAARTYAHSEAVLTVYGMGLTQQVMGVDNVHVLANFALLRGNIGKPGANICAVRGHSNVQGWSAGLATSLLLCGCWRSQVLPAMNCAGWGRIRMETGRSSATWRRIMSRGSNSLASPSRERATPIFGRLRD